MVAGEVKCPEKGEVEDSTRNQLENGQSWENKGFGKDFSCENVEEGSEEITWDGYGGTSMGGQRATDYSVNSEESGYSSLKDKQVGSYRTRCQIKVLFECERRHFSSPRKKHFYFTKSFPNGIIGCVERGFYKKITRSQVSGDQVIRCCSDLMFPPKRDFILKKSLFLDGVHVQMINLVIKKFTHRLSALPQPYCSLSESPLSSLLSPCQLCSCPAA